MFGKSGSDLNFKSIAPPDAYEIREEMPAKKFFNVKFLVLFDEILTSNFYMNSTLIKIREVYITCFVGVASYTPGQFEFEIAGVL